MNWYKKANILEPTEKEMWKNLVKKHPSYHKYAPEQLETKEPKLYNYKNTLTAGIIDWVLGLPLLCDYNDPKDPQQIQDFMEEHVYDSILQEPSEEQMAEYKTEAIAVITDSIRFAESGGQVFPQTSLLNGYIIGYLDDYYNNFADTEEKKIVTLLTKKLQENPVGD